MIDCPDTIAPIDVSRGTLAQLERYAALLTDWQTRINLIGPNTLPDLWQRHFVDSFQLIALAPPTRNWLDIGAGAGFPGLVIAIAEPQSRVTLVESITKKCRFLQAVVDDLQLHDRVTIENRRVEALPPQKFDIITARALAPLHRLFDWGLVHAGPMTRWILPKGARFAEELETATQSFRFKHDLAESRTDPAARIVVATQVQRR